MQTDTGIAMEKLFHPRSVAVAGASGNPNNLGSRSLKQIKDFGFTGSLCAVNPKGQSSGGVPGYRSLVNIPGPVDLCLIAVPAAAVGKVVADCVAKGVPVAQILTSGFGEAGAEGRRAEQAILAKAAGKTRLVGPNCMGVYSAPGGLNFVATAEKTPGQISIASQSGGLSIDMILQAKARGLKLNKLASIGNCIDLGPEDFLGYFGHDPETEVIGLYLEGVKPGRNFPLSLQEAASYKPVVLLKGGRTGLGAKSVASHTNSLAGQYATWQAAVSQAGAIMVDNVDDFLASLTALQSYVPRMRGKAAALVGNGGGATVLATDNLAELGLTLAVLRETTLKAMADIQMPAGSTVGNPTDTPVGALNKSGSEALGEVVDQLLADPGVDGAVVHFNLVPFINYENRRDIAEGVSAALRSMAGKDKPVYVALRSVPDAPLETLRAQILETIKETGLPCFQSAGEAVRTLAAVHQWTKRPVIDREQEKASPPEQVLAKGREIMARLKEKGYSAVPQEEAFQLLDVYGIPHPQARLAADAAQAVIVAEAIGYPVALKLDSPDILHKTEAGGVRLGLGNREEVCQAFREICESARRYRTDARINGVLVQAMSRPPLQEMICGLKRDPVFGPTLLLGLGGLLVEVLQDVSLRVLPLSARDARSMWQKLDGSALLTGYRGRPRADTTALEDLLQKVAVLGRMTPEISEMDLNPVMVWEEGSGITVVDCRIVLDFKGA